MRKNKLFSLNWGTKPLAWIGCMLMLTCGWGTLAAQVSITSLFPNPACENQTILVTGTGFAANSTATVDGQNANLTFSSATQVLVELPTSIQYFDSIPLVVTTGGNNASDSLWVEGGPVDLQYASQVFCTGGGVVLPIIVSPVGGIFFSNPAGLVFDATNGSINLAASVPGVYTVGYTITSPAGCPRTDLDTLQIIQSSATNMYYSDPTPGSYPRYCSASSISPTPVITGAGGGTFTANSPGLVFTDGSPSPTGAIDLASSAPSTNYYIITYTVGGTCATQIQDTLYIDEVISTSIDYAQDAYCQSEVDPLPTVTGAGSGTFFDVNLTGNLVINSSTGRIDLAASVPQVYEIGFSAFTGCATVSTDLVEVLSSPDLILTYGESNDSADFSICLGTEVTFRALGGGSQDDIYRFVLDDSLILQPDATGPFANEFVTADLPSGIHILSVMLTTSVDGCVATDEIEVEVLPTPVLEFLDIPKTICSGDIVGFNLLSLTDSTRGFLDMQGIGDVVPNRFGLQTNVLNANETYFVALPTVILVDDLSKATLVYTVVPDNHVCAGLPIKDSVCVIPCTNDLFVPGVFTPNGDGVNDTWEIGWPPNLDPNEVSVEVFNRVGAKVFMMNPLNDQWNGGNLPDGTYWYVAKHLTSDQLLHKGGVVIRRD